MTWSYITKAYLLDGVDPKIEEWDKNILKMMMDKINAFIVPIIEKTKLDTLESVKIMSFRLKCVKDALDFIYNSNAFEEPMEKDIICSYAEDYDCRNLLDSYGITEYTVDTCDDYEMMLKVFEFNSFDTIHILRLINSIINELNNL